MIEYFIQFAKWILELWGFLPKDVKDKVKQQAADSMDDVFRKYYGSAKQKAAGA